MFNTAKKLKAMRGQMVVAEPRTGTVTHCSRELASVAPITRPVLPDGIRIDASIQGKMLRLCQYPDQIRAMLMASGIPHEKAFPTEDDLKMYMDHLRAHPEETQGGEGASASPSPAVVAAASFLQDENAFEIQGGGIDDAFRREVCLKFAEDCKRRVEHFADMEHEETRLVCEFTGAKTGDIVIGYWPLPIPICVERIQHMRVWQADFRAMIVLEIPQNGHPLFVCNGFDSNLSEQFQVHHENVLTIKDLGSLVSVGNPFATEILLRIQAEHAHCFTTAAFEGLFKKKFENILHPALTMPENKWVNDFGIFFDQEGNPVGLESALMQYKALMDMPSLEEERRKEVYGSFMQELKDTPAMQVWDKYIVKCSSPWYNLYMSHRLTYEDEKAMGIEELPENSLISSTVDRTTVGEVLEGLELHMKRVFRKCCQHLCFFIPQVDPSSSV